MKVGDLVKIISHGNPDIPTALFLVTKVYGSHGLVSLCGFPNNQVFREEHLKVISEAG